MTPTQLSQTPPPPPPTTTQYLGFKMSDFSQNVVDDACDAIEEIMRTKVVYVTGPERPRLWQEAIDEMEVQLVSSSAVFEKRLPDRLKALVRSVEQPGLLMPRFLIALDIHLQKREGPWPAWDPIIKGDTSQDPGHRWLQMRAPTPPVSTPVSETQAGPPHSEPNPSPNVTPPRSTSPRKSAIDLTSPVVHSPRADRRETRKRNAKPAEDADSKSHGKLPQRPEEGPRPILKKSGVATAARPTSPAGGQTVGADKRKGKARQLDPEQLPTEDEERGRSLQKIDPARRSTRSKSRIEPQAEAASGSAAAPSGAAMCTACERRGLECKRLGNHRACTECH